VERLKYLFETIDALFESCDMDFDALICQTIDAAFFEDYANQRIVNSFLFNYIKIQDKMGAKLFRSVLYELKEIDDESVPMKDVLNRLEKLRLVEHAGVWDELREIRNAIAHEYPLAIDERMENIGAALEGYDKLKQLYALLRGKVERHE
jgi:hypothetical protein